MWSSALALPITLIKIKMLKHLSITYVDSFLFIRSPFVGRLRNSAWSVVLLLRGGSKAEQGPHAARNMEFIMWSNKQPTEQRPTDDRESNVNSDIVIATEAEAECRSVSQTLPLSPPLPLSSFEIIRGDCRSGVTRHRPYYLRFRIWSSEAMSPTKIFIYLFVDWSGSKSGGWWNYCPR